MKNRCLEKANRKGETEHGHKQAREKESKGSENRQGTGRERRLKAASREGGLEVQEQDSPSSSGSLQQL